MPGILFRGLKNIADPLGLYQPTPSPAAQPAQKPAQKPARVELASVEPGASRFSANETQKPRPNTEMAALGMAPATRAERPSAPVPSEPAGDPDLPPIKAATPEAFTEVVAAGAGWTEVTDGSGQRVRREGSRNWRNNNPGNIEYGDFAKSMGAVGTDGRFAVFPTYEQGRAAKEKLLFETSGYKDKTLSEAISRYAPAFENDTNGYMNQVAKAAGVTTDTRLSDLTGEQRVAMLDAMERVEGFRVGKTIVDGKPRSRFKETPEGENAPVPVAAPGWSDPERQFAGIHARQPENEAGIPASDKPAGQGLGALSFVKEGQDKIQPAFAAILKQTSADVGRPLTINSGYRSPAYNAKIGAGKGSRHPHGDAADISMKGMSEAERANLVQSLIANGASRFITYSRHPDMLHVDMSKANGPLWFMHDKSNRNLGKAPKWFREIAGGDHPAPGTAKAKPVPSYNQMTEKGTGLPVRVDFSPKDPLGLYQGRENPLSGRGMPTGDRIPVPSARPDPVSPSGQPGAPVIDDGIDTIVNDMNAENPGRYTAMSPEEYIAWKKEFDAKNKSTGLGGDVDRLIKRGGAQAGLGIRELVRNIPGGETIIAGTDAIAGWLAGEDIKPGDVDRKMGEISDRATATMTPAQRAASTKEWVTETTDANGDTHYGLGPAWKDPRSYFGGLVESVPSTAATMFPSGILAQGTYKAAIGAGLGPKQAAAKSATTAMVAGSIGEAMISGGQTAVAVREKIEAMPRDVLAQSDAVKAMVGQGMSEDEAIAAITDDAATKAMVISGVITGAFGGRGDYVMAKILSEGVEGTLGQRIRSGIARGAVSEGLLEELPQSAGEQIAQNIGVRTVDEDQRLLEGVPNAAAGGAVSGGLMGAGMGGAGGALSQADPAPAAVPDAQPAPQPTPATGQGETFVVNAPADAARGIPAEDIHGMTVRKADSQDGVADGMVRIVLPDGKERVVGTGLLAAPDPARSGGLLSRARTYSDSRNAAPVTEPGTVSQANGGMPVEPGAAGAAGAEAPPAAPAAAPADATQPSAQNLPSVGTTVTVSDPDIGEFGARVESIEGDDAIVFDPETGEIYQVPLSTITSPDPVKDRKESKIADTPVDPGSTQAQTSPEIAVNVSPELSPETEIAGDSLPASQKSEKVAVKVSPQLSTPKQEKPVVAENATSDASVPVQEKPSPVVASGKAVSFPDENHRAIFDLGEKLSLGRKSSLSMDRVRAALRKEREALADRLGIAPEAVESLASDYRRRTLRAAQEAGADTQSASAPNMAKIIDRYRAEAAQAPLFDTAANEAATSPTNALPEPTQAQKEAGNYKLGHAALSGLNLSIENPAGSQRKGVDKDGKPWSVTMKSHYGYIKGTVARDKDHVDAFIRPGTETIADNAPVFVVDQVDENGEFDEHKVMLGFDTIEQAREAYMENYTKGWKGLGAITAVPFKRFKDWTRDADATKRPFGRLPDVAANEAPRNDDVVISLDRNGDWDFNDRYPAPDPDLAAALERDGRLDLDRLPDGSFDPEQVSSVIEETMQDMMIRRLDALAARKELDAIDAGKTKLKPGKPIEDRRKALQQSIAQDEAALDDLTGALVDLFGDDAAKAIRAETTRRVDREIKTTDQRVRTPKEGRKAEADRKPGSRRKTADNGKGAGRTIPRDTSIQVFAPMVDLGIDTPIGDGPRGEAAKRSVVKNGKTFGVEFLVALDANGDVVINSRGLKSSIGIFPRDVPIISDPSERITIHHNHPSSRSFSPSDLAMLRYPGIVAVYAHGHDGTTHRARPTPMLRALIEREIGGLQSDKDGTEQQHKKLSGLFDQYFGFTQMAGQRHLDELNRNRMAKQGKAAIAVLDKHQATLVSMAMGEVGLIEYEHSADPSEMFTIPGIAEAYEATKEAIARATADLTYDDRPAEPVRHPGDVEIVPKRNGKPAAKPAARADADAVPQGDRPSGEGQREEVSDQSPDVTNTGGVFVAPPEKPVSYDEFAGNKIFTADKVAAARARLKSKMGQINSGIDPEMLIDGMTIAGAYIESGVRRFSDHAEKMVGDFGDGIRPYLLSFYEGARNYPGLDTDGMSSPDEARAAHADLMNPGIPESEKIAVGEVVPSPRKRAKRSGRDEDMTLTDDWGVSHIDGNDAEDERPYGPTKDAFLKEATKYLKTVASTLEDRGFDGVRTKPGRGGTAKTMKPVTRNDAGVAVSGDASLYMEHPETGARIYVQITGSSLRGVVPATRSGVSMMMRIGTKSYATDGANQWLPVDMTAGEVGAKLLAHYDTWLSRQKPKDQAADGRAAELDQRSESALEGIPADPVRPSGEERDARPAPPASGQPDLFGTQPDGGERDGPAGRMGSGAREVPVPAGREASQPVGSVRTNTTANNQPTEFAISDDDQIGEGGAKTKFRQNVEAIRIIRLLDDESRPATRDEQKVLAKWVGWGGLQQAFYREDGSVAKGWEKQAEEIKALLSDEEYAAAVSSTRNAHYTAPEVVKAMWNAVDRLGFTGGRVLEPSVGSGNFLGLMPGNMRSGSAIVGAELDNITGSIAKHLYPKATIKTPLGFEKLTLPDNAFDLAIGNPPFGSERLYDPERKAVSKFSIHNFFFAKSLDTLKPGGVLAMVVSNFLLDANRSQAREYMADRADLIAAIRLPNDAFLKNAGTEVTTDIVFLRKRMDGDRPGDRSWTETGTFTDTEGREMPLNRYFLENPDMMLGKFGGYGTMYGQPDNPALISRPGDDLPSLLAEAIAKLPRGITASTPVNTVTVAEKAPKEAADALVNSLFIDAGGTLHMRISDEYGEPRSAPWEAPNERALERVKGMIRVRDVFTQLRRAQVSETATTERIEELRAQLNKAYDGFVKDNGPINLDANKRLLRDDPTWPQLAALEDKFDRGVSATVAKSTGEKPRAPSARKAAIFTKRTQQPYRRPTSAKTAKDALAQVMADFNRVDMAQIMRLYPKPEAEIVSELGPLIYQMPTGGYDSAEAYLSGNVKKKLAEAIEAVADNPALERNVKALEDVIPADVEAVDINVKAGAPWVPANHMADFIDFITGSPGAKATYSPMTGKWIITAQKATDAASVDYATDRIGVSQILDAAINDKQLQVYDKMGDGSSVINPAATEAANGKVQKVKDAWGEWIWEDEARRAELHRIYNDTFNTDRLREYDGSHLSLPGKVSDSIIELRPHQKNFVWRGLQSSTVLADHTVGAGKTFAAIALIMEWRRTGTAKKPMLVVPNHLVGQWAADFIKLYPGAKVLAATKKDFEAGNRKRLFARMATGDYDAIIVAHSTFGRIGVDPEFEREFINKQIADIEVAEAALRQEMGKDGRNSKQLGKWRDSLKARLEKLMDAGSKDDGLTFNEIGIDAIAVDEAHEFKNLAFATSMNRVAGLGNPTGSQKAADLYMKISAVKSRTGGRNIAFLTGTPISNTMAEMFTMQRYLDEEALSARGINHFDAWANVFGQVVTDFELSPAGKYTLKSRFAKFVNMPELITRYRSFADVISNNDIQAMLAARGERLPIPKIKGGKPQNIVVERSQDQAYFIGVPHIAPDGNEFYPANSLIHRAENLPKKAEKGADNMLKIMSDARKAALDMRLIDPSYDDHPGSKANRAADEMLALYRKWDADKGAQLVFIDLSTPKGAIAKEKARVDELFRKAEEGDEAAQEALDKMSPDELDALNGGFDVYNDLKSKLIDRGIPEHEIAFIHDANTDLQKETLFGKVRSGQVRFLFGSTAKMGAGTNVQDRLVGLHHLDAPWRPSDMEQREGRIIRQGNALYARDPEGFEVVINRYATENSLDSRMYQTIEQKATFIGQVRKGVLGQREIEDIGGEAANAAEMKAAASGNPLILEEVELRKDIRTLENRKREHAREQFRIQDRVRDLEGEAAALSEEAPLAARDAEDAPVALNAGGMRIGDVLHEKQGDAGAAMIDRLLEMVNAGESTIEVGQYGPFRVDGHVTGVMKKPMLAIVGQRTRFVTIDDILTQSPAGLGQKVRNAVAAMVDRPRLINERLSAISDQLPKLKSKLLGSFPDQDRLDALQTRHREVLEILKPKPKAAQPAPDATAEKAPDDADLSMNPYEGIDWSAARTRLDATQQRQLRDIIRTVAGDGVSVRFAERIDVPAGSAGAKAWGDGDGPSTAAGMYLPGEAAVVLALDSATRGTAYHEAFHHVQRAFLSEAERAILASKPDRLHAIIESNPFMEGRTGSMAQKELEAEAFATWANAKAAERSNLALPGTVRLAWGKIIRLIERVRNAVNGWGFRTVEDVFEAAFSGSMAARTRAQSGDDAPSFQINPQPGDAKPVASPTQSRILDMIKGRFTDLQPAMLALVPMNYFNELKRPNMSAVDDYLKVKQQMDAYRGDRHAKSNEVAQRWLSVVGMGLGKGNSPIARDLAALMHESTLAGVDPSKAENLDHPDYARLRQMFEALPEKAQAIYEEVRDSYKEQSGELDKILLGNVRKAFMIAQKRAEEVYLDELDRIRKRVKDPAEAGALKKEAEKTYNAAARRAHLSMAARITRLRQIFESSRVPAPYFPLARFGRYFVSVRDQQGELISFSKRETSAQAKALSDEMRRAYPDAEVDMGVMGEKVRARDQMDPRIVTEIESILGESALSNPEMASVMDQIWQRYLDSMPDLSIRKRFIHRSGVAGFDTDALRGYSSHMFHAAHQMAKLKFGMELTELTRDVERQARRADKPVEAVNLSNELGKRHEWVMNPTGSSFAQSITSTAFVWYLAKTPAAAMINLTQTVMMGVPILGARYGLTKAAAALAKASGDSLRGYGLPSKNANLTEDEKAAFEVFYESGLVDRTQSHDLAGVGDTGVRYSPVRQRVMGVISWAFHNAERWNREVTALAAYRLARDAQKANGDQHSIRTNAIDAAHKLTWKTHFDYSNSSRPRFMQNDAMKVAMVFRSHNINMLYRLTRDIHQIMKGDTPEARREARFQLAGIVGMQALMAGAAGIVGFNLAMAITGMFLQDDDDPFDYEMRFRQNVLEALGPELGGIVLDGAPGHYTGWQLSSRIGMPDLWFRSPNRDLEGKDEFNYWVMNAAGASVSMLGDWFRGISLVREGETVKGIEAMVPKFFKDQIRAYRYAKEGVTDLAGNEVLPADQIDAWDIVSQMIGFTPQKIGERWDRNSALKNADSRIQKKRSRLLADYALAHKMGDDAMKKEVLERIGAFNEYPLHRGKVITPKTLRDSLRRRQILTRKRQDGVLIQNERLSRDLRNELPEAIYE